MGTERDPLERLLRDCRALDEPAATRPPARERLDEELGPELAAALVAALAEGVAAARLSGRGDST